MTLAYVPLFEIASPLSLIVLTYFMGVIIFFVMLILGWIFIPVMHRELDMVHLVIGAIIWPALAFVVFKAAIKAALRGEE